VRTVTERTHCNDGDRFGRVAAGIGAEPCYGITFVDQASRFRK
jgi:hypothetical protein